MVPVERATPSVEAWSVLMNCLGTGVPVKNKNERFTIESESIFGMFRAADCGSVC
jgi:hypothetical protein